MSRRPQQLPLFHPRYASRCAPKSRALPHPYLHENQHRPVAHDEIDFTRSAAIVSPEQNKVMMSKKGFRVTLRLAAIQNKNSVGTIIQVSALTIARLNFQFYNAAFINQTPCNRIEPDRDTARHLICYRHTYWKPARHHAEGT